MVLVAYSVVQYFSAPHHPFYRGKISDYKNHAKVDARSKLIVTYAESAANVHDSLRFKALIDKQDQTVFADSAYNSQELEEYLLRECDAEEYLLFKLHIKRPLNEEEHQLNRLRSRIRCRVEHVFGRLPRWERTLFELLG